MASSIDSGSGGVMTFLRETATSRVFGVAASIVSFTLIIFVCQIMTIDVFRLRQIGQPLPLPLSPGFNVNGTRLRQDFALRNVTNSRAVAAAAAAAAAVQPERLQLLRETCSTLKRSRPASASSRRPPHNVVNHELNYFYCAIPKVACTSFLAVLAAANGAPPGLNVHSGATRDRYLEKLQQFSAPQQRDVLQNHFRFMFVRHPFSRLASAYRNKFAEMAGSKSSRSAKHFKGIATEIKIRYRSNDKDGMVTFREFVRYLLDPQTRREKPFDRHWRPYAELCQPCSIQYDFIGHYETIEDDSLYVLRKIGIDNRVKFPRKNSHKNTTRYQQYFAELKPAEVDGLRRIYWLDFQLFGYE